jgi:selenoprotein W-related protein
MAQELLFTFTDTLGEVALVPGESGQFSVSVDGTIVFDRAVEGRFPESKELKRLVRDAVDPGREMGHLDR